MANLVVVGAQWGDEGKGKLVDVLAARADVVVRYQGGANAGHTVVADGRKVVLHLLPSGVLHPAKACVLGNGMVVDPKLLLEELDALTAQGLVGPDVRLVVSPDAHVIMPWHRLLDSFRERASGGRALGTTGRGIGPAYEDKAARRGVRIRDLLRPGALARRVLERLPSALEELRDLSKALNVKAPELLSTAIVEDYASLGSRLAPYVQDASVFLTGMLHQGARILFEGAQGTQLDVDHGTYPYVTSSNTVAGNAAVGSGLGPTALHSVLGVAKAYSTRVGAGPFPTELIGDLGDQLRQRGAEFGATTGRPRRCGWLDALVLRHAVRVNGLTSLAITKLDVLAGLPSVRIATAYRLGERTVHELPGELEDLEGAVPVYEDLPGWADLGEVDRVEALPAAAQGFLKRLEELCGIPVSGVSVGPDRRQTFFPRDPFEKP